MSDALSGLPKTLIEERGMPSLGVAIWRKGENSDLVTTTVGEFLSRTENQSGRWLIDGGWGGPPGPIAVEWREGKWINLGFPPHDGITKAF